MKLWHCLRWVFAILSICLIYSCQSASAITRGDVANRAQGWVNVPVTYSQTSYYGGYRQDCSGYLSYCWATVTASGLPVSYNTNSLLTITFSITQADLKQGDILLNTAGGNTASEFAHVVLFDHWSDSTHTKYWVCEQGPDKTHYHEIPYPYWSDYDPQEYAPRRYQSIDDGGVDPANPYVDGGYGGTQIGTAANPFKTVLQAVNAASATLATIHIAPGTYGERIGTSKHILFVTWGSGTVRIGG